MDTPSNQAVFGEVTAYLGRGGVRFMKDKKWIAEAALQPEVVAYLYNKLGVEMKPKEEKPAPKFPMPSEEEKARLRAESLKVKPELQLTPEEQAERASLGVPDNEAPLTPDDFDAPDADGNEPLPRTDEPVALPEVVAELEQHLDNSPEFHKGYAQRAEEDSPSVDPSFLETVSIHTAPLEALVQALYDRFGVYTVYLKDFPKSDEVNPLTGEPFTKYHLGIAYQAAVAANANGIRNPEKFRQSIDAGRAASENFQDQFVPPPVTLGDARQQNSFAYRTSVQGAQPGAATQIKHMLGEDGEMHAIQVPVPVTEAGGTAASRYDADEDEQVVEPPIFGTKPIIKPNW